MNGNVQAQMILEKLDVISEGILKRKKYSGWRGYRARKYRKVTKAKDIFSQWINFKSRIQKIDPYNAKRYAD